MSNTQGNEKKRKAYQAPKLQVITLQPEEQLLACTKIERPCRITTLKFS